MKEFLYFRTFCNRTFYTLGLLLVGLYISTFLSGLFTWNRYNLYNLWTQRQLRLYQPKTPRKELARFSLRLPHPLSYLVEGDEDFCWPIYE